MGGKPYVVPSMYDIEECLEAIRAWPKDSILETTTPKHGAKAIREWPEDREDEMTTMTKTTTKHRAKTPVRSKERNQNRAQSQKLLTQHQ